MGIKRCGLCSCENKLCFAFVFASVFVFVLVIIFVLSSGAWKLIVDTRWKTGFGGDRASHVQSGRGGAEKFSVRTLKTLVFCICICICSCIWIWICFCFQQWRLRTGFSGNWASHVQSWRGAGERGPFENQDKAKKYLVNICIRQALLPVL